MLLGLFFSYHLTMMKHINAHRLTVTSPSAIMLLTLPISTEATKAVLPSVVDLEKMLDTTQSVGYNEWR